MDFGTLLNVAQTLFASLQCSELKEMWSILGYKSELDDLTRTVNTVKAVLLDAESKQDNLSHEALLWVRELKDAVYDADDLVDEFVTLAKQKKHMQGSKFSKEVRLFFSRYNQLSVAHNMSRGVKKIRNKLDGIASNHTKFGLTIDHSPIRKRREETCSYVNSTIIGRDQDVENIVGMLLESYGNQDVSFLSIVGMGGLGKTALAQLVFNDEKVVTEFDLRLWTCVSDQDHTQFDVKTVLAQILGRKHDDSTMEVLMSELREKLGGRRFLIVLDDVWTENRHEWLKLVRYLMGGKRGSWVVVTTRSKETANVVGNSHVYELQGLSDENSWRLFQLVAFEQVLDQANSNPHVDLINIGQNIVKYCANVPLAIRVVGSLLYGRDKSKWLSIQESGLAIPMEAFQSLTYLFIGGDQEVEILTEFEQVFCACSSSLRTLWFKDCPKLRCISGGLRCLAHLERLVLHRIPIVSVGDEKMNREGEDDGMPWGSLCHTLQHLQISYCKELRSLPRWLCKLTSLRRLEVWGCSIRLYKRCQRSTGEDWPNIQHIPHILIKLCLEVHAVQQACTKDAKVQPEKTGPIFNTSLTF